MNDDPVFLLSPISIASFQIARGFCGRGIVVCFSISQYTGDAGTKGFRLVPAAIGERRVVRSRRS